MHFVHRAPRRLLGTITTTTTTTNDNTNNNNDNYDNDNDNKPYNKIMILINNDDNTNISNNTNNRQGRGLLREAEADLRRQRHLLRGEPARTRTASPVSETLERPISRCETFQWSLQRAKLLVRPSRVRLEWILYPGVSVRRIVARRFGGFN